MNMNDRIDQATTEQLRLAVRSLMLGLAGLGFGTDEPVNGADAVEAIAELFDDVAGRVLQRSDQDGQNANNAQSERVTS